MARRRSALALLSFIAALAAASVEAQTTVVASTSTEVSVEARVTTTETVTVTSGAPAEAVEAEPPVRVLLHPRVEFHIGDELDYDFAAWGASVLIGADVGKGWGGGLAIGHLSDIGGGASEVSLGLEVARDFAPDGDLGFRLTGRIGPAFMLGDGVQDSGVRLVAQLAIGMRLGFDPRVAFTLDLGGAARYSPDHAALSAAMVITTGMVFFLD